MSTPGLLLRAAHGGPALAVTVVAALLALGAGHDGPSGALVVAAVLAGQLVIGWSNDLVDLPRDRLVGREDKPLATGELSATTVATALAAAGVACLLLSALLGWPAAACHLLLVAAGVAYNVRLKSTWWSWLPYAVAFGALPAVVTLALPTPEPPAAWMVVTGSLLGVGAHLVNVLPDLEDDAATGVRGLPHRLGSRTAQLTATVLLVTATLVMVATTGWPPPPGAWLALVLTLVLALVALRGTGRASFRAAVGIALVDVVMLTIYA